MPDTLATMLADPAARQELARRLQLPRLDFFAAVDSTQRIVKELAADGAAEWTLVVADYQATGRGQHGRSWTAPAGTSVMFSVLLRPASLESMSLIPIRAGLAIAAAIERMGAATGLSTRKPMLKWPNDLIIADGKAGGILCEGQIRGEELCSVVGIGLNVFPFEHGLKRDLPPTFIGGDASGASLRLEIFTAVVRALHERLEAERSTLTESELEEFARRDWLRGKMIDEPATGRVAGIDRNGHLTVEKVDGGIDTLVAGTVRLGTIV